MSIVVRSSFWNNPIVQHLQNIINTSTVRLKESQNITCDILFTFANSLAFFFLDINKIDENMYQICEKMAKSFRSLIIIIKLDDKSYDKYIEFVSKVTQKVHSIIYLEPDNFDYNAAKSVWNMVSNTQNIQRNINMMIEERRRAMMNPTETAKKVINKMIKEEKRKEEVFNHLSLKNSTLRSTLLECVPELFEENFFISQEDDK